MSNCCFRSALRVLAVVGAVSALSATTLGQTLNRGKVQPVKKVQAATPKAKPVANRGVAAPATPKVPSNLTTGTTPAAKEMSQKLTMTAPLPVAGKVAGPNLTLTSKNVAPSNGPIQRGAGAADNCGDAPDVGEGTFAYDLANATNDFAGTCGATTTAPDVWYRYVATQDGNATFSTCGLTSGDSAIALLAECGGPQLACVDDACGLQSSITFPVVNGEDYYLRLAGFNGNRHAGEVAISISVPPPCTDNDCCAMATVVTVPSTNDYDLTGATNDWPGSCAAGATAPDRWFVFTAPEDGTAIVSTCGLTTGDSAITILDECGGPQILCLDDFCGLQTEVSFSVSSGEDYYIRMSGFNGNIHSGQFSVSMLGPCVLTPPGKGTPEGEECGSDANGGCNSAPPIFGSISCGEVVSGTAWASGGTRDTDWYTLTLDGPHEITVSGQAQFPLQLFVISDGCPAAIISAASASRCNTASMTVLVSGTVTIFAGNSGFDGNPCGGDNDYWLSVDSCTPVEGPANDNCADAEAITGGGPFFFDNTIASTDGAPDPLCDSFGSSDIANDLWYEWTASCAEGEQATLELCGQTSIDSRVAVYEGTECVGQIVGCNDDACGLQSRVRWIPVPGQVYKIRVGNFPGAAGGPGSFTIACSEAPVPVCTAFDPGTDCQTSAFLIAYNVSLFTTAENYNSLGQAVNSICLQGIYFNNIPVTDNWVISFAEDTGTGVPGAIIDTFTQGVDMVVSGPTPTGPVFVGREVMEWRLDVARPITRPAGECVWVIMNNFADGDSVFLMDGDAANGNLQAAQDLNQDGVFSSPAEVIPDDIYLCVNGGLGDAGACLVDPCEGNVPSNDECSGAIALSINETLQGDTSCAQPESLASCSGAAFANTVWYTVTGTGNTMTVDTCASANYDTRLELYCGDCSNPVCIGSNDDFCGLQSGVTWCSQAGGTYLVAVHAFGAGSGVFDITLSDDGAPCANPPECVPCLGIDPSPVGVEEAEACGDDTNGGCNINPFAFETIACNAVINGTTWATAGTRDTDWYQVTVPASGTVSASVTSEVPVVVFILTISEAGGAPDCVTVTLVSSAEVLPCGTAVISASGLAAGSHAYFFVSTGNLSAGIFDGFACGQGIGNDYVMSVDIGCGNECPCDFNNNGDLNSQDFFDFLNCFFTPGCPDADFNNNNVVNSQDFFDFLNCFFAPPAGCN